MIPNKSILELMGEYFVYESKDTLVRDKKDSTKTRPVLMAIQKRVQLGQTIPPNVIINNGIKVGDHIVVDGVQSLHTGSIITIAKMPENAKNRGTKKHK